MSEATHEHLWNVARLHGQDYAPYGRDQRDADGQWGPDCSMGCAYFAELAGRRGADWGVCTNPASHRVGLLTFEHQGCRHFTPLPPAERGVSADA